MSLIDFIIKPAKAGIKYGLRTANDNSYNKKIKEAHKTSFKKVGYKIESAKKKHKQIDAKNMYANINKKKVNKIEQKYNRINKLLDEI